MFKKEKKLAKAQKALGGMHIIGASSVPAQIERQDKPMVYFAPEFYQMVKAMKLAANAADQSRIQNGKSILREIL